MLLNVGWTLVSVLNYSSLAVALIGIVIFGRHFIRSNGRSAQAGQDKIPMSAWRGPQAVRGLKFLGISIIMQITSIVVSLLLPARL